MTTNQNTTKSKKVKDLNSQLNDLLGEAKKANQDIDATNKESEEVMNDLEARVNKSTANVEKICSELDTIEKEAGDKLDKLVLEEAENLASDE